MGEGRRGEKRKGERGEGVARSRVKIRSEWAEKPKLVIQRIQRAPEKAEGK